MESMSLRTARMRALAPRLLLYGAIFMLSVAGLRAAISGPAETAAAPPPPPPPVDVGAHAFAEGFTRVYLSWDSGHLEPRQRALDAYMSDELDADGGLYPDDSSSQNVTWTAAVGTRRSGPRTLVTVAAQTTEGVRYLTVPVTRDDRGFLSVSAYPALVGPPATTGDPDLPTEEEVEQAPLLTVAERAVRNYLGRSVANLRADLTPGAVVSLPEEPLRAAEPNLVTWVDKPARIAVEVEAEDRAGTTWTLRYELDVVKSDRWYVRSLQVDPTFKGGASG
jgi:hypothetical protein